MSDVVTVGTTTITLGPLDRERHGAACARVMCESEPWRSLGRTYERSLAVIHETSQEAYAAITPAGEPVGLLLLMMQGALVGYVRSIVVHPDWRSRGLGATLMQFAERRAHQVSPNVFLMVSALNVRALGFYQRLGYNAVGPVPQFLVAGQDEILLWKSAGPLGEWRPTGVHGDR